MLPETLSDNLANLAKPPTIPVLATTTSAPTTLADTTNKLAQASSPAPPPLPPQSVPVFLSDALSPLLFAAVSPVEVLMLCTLEILSKKTLQL